jgi:trimeric autotransporter adhesin
MTLPFQAISIANAPFGAPNRPYRVRTISVLPGPADPEGVFNFVTVSPSAGGTPMVAHVTLNPKVVPYMRPGVYSLVVRLEYADVPPAAELPPGLVVSLVLSHPGKPEITSIVDAASLQPRISPGQLVTIRGLRLSTPPLTGEPDAMGLFPTVLGNTRVTFNGVAAPLLYVSNEQINCVVPHAVAGSRSAEVVVSRVHDAAGVSDPSLPFTVALADTAPGIFTSDGSGAGPASVLNVNPAAGTNSEDNPAPLRSTIRFFATGAGAWNVKFPDGQLVLRPTFGGDPRLPPLLAPSAPVFVTIGGKTARVVRAAAQRNQVYGMLEVDAEIPEGTGSGVQPLVLKVGDSDNSEQKVTVWVRD